jgi:hypothetical protein
MHRLSWHPPVILATCETEIWKIKVQGQPGVNCSRDPASIELEQNGWDV